MTTTDGMATLRRVRLNIERIRDRLEYLEDKDAEAREWGARENGYVKAEIDALRWALPILETEWDTAARFNRNLRAIEGRLKSEEMKPRRPTDHRRVPVPEWETSTPVVPVTPTE